MIDERYKLLMSDDAAKLTSEELFETWHFCPEFDGLLRKSKDEDYVLDGEVHKGFECDCFKD